MSLTMDERLDREAKGWKPNAGDKLVGEIIDRVDGIEGGFEPYSILTVETDDGEIVDLHCFHTTLRSEVSRRNPQPGDRIGVKYYGKVEGGQYKNGFEKYQVYLERKPVPAVLATANVPQQVAEALRQPSRPVVVEAQAPVPTEADRPEDDESV